MRFELIQQPFSYKPIFTEFTPNSEQFEIRFKMVEYDNESHVSPHTLRYVLSLREGAWSGQLIQSWAAPLDVTLHKQE
jgi:hypothetical protein